MSLSVIRKPLEYLLYPALLGGSMLAWAVLWKYLGWDSGIALQVIYWAFFAVLFALERFYPFEPAWNRTDGQIRNDVTMSILNIALNSVTVVVVVWAIVWIMNTFQPLASLQVWPTHWPMLVQVIPGIIVYDLGNHLAHRWAHKIPLLWRFHSVHHSAPRLCVINTGRFHPIDIVKSVVIGAPIPFLLGMPAEIAEWYAAWYVYIGLLTHANIKLRCGVFNYLLSTPELHRWHHSPVRRETDTNFGETTMVWDHLFGTYFFPAERGPRRNLGLEGSVPVSTRLLEAMYQPLTPAGHRASPENRIRSLPAGEAGVEPSRAPMPEHSEPLATR
jgi:sterol desaturase/sphingolipid hydroxylase (fatty acid hydroxylase superfamily)